MKLLIKFNKDWADEFDVYGLAIMTECEWQTFVAGIPDLTYNFGTNEGWEEPGEIDEDDFEAVAITYSEELVLQMAIFGYTGQGSPKTTYGNFPQ